MQRLTLSILLILIAVAPSIAQQRVVERTFEVAEREELQLDLRFGDNINVQGWDKNEVAFKAVIEINSGKLNDALELDFDQGSGLRIASDYNHEKLKMGRREDCPASSSRFSMDSSGNGNYVVCSTISYELYVPHDMDLDVGSISGDIELVGLHGPIRAKSVSGDVDLSWPSDTTVDIDLKTVSGEAFTDLENLHFSNKKSHIPIVGYKLKGKVGTGGPRVSLESVSGNVYLRKAKS
jgi:hypothetical protein